MTITRRPHNEVWITRHVFPEWSVEVPRSFEETFVEDDAYWHAFDRRRSISISSYLVVDSGPPVSLGELAAAAAQLLPNGSPMDELPDGIHGRAVMADVVPRTRASRALSGVLVAEGRMLVVTITSDDEGWSRRVWSSIRHHPDELPTEPRRRAMAA